MENRRSRCCGMNKGLLQGSVLSPTLFNLYVSDLLKTKGTKFQLADDIAIAYQSKDFIQGEKTLNEDLQELNRYFRSWRLKPNPNKTEVYAFYLTNKQANTELEVIFNVLLLTSKQWIT